jgi:Na+/H+ antiporter NhaB
MQDTLIVILSFVLPNFIGGMLFLLSFLISKNTKSSLEEGFRLTQMWVVLAVAAYFYSAHDKIRVQKRDVNRKHDRKSIKRFRRKRLGASIAYANTT